jgi:hypothetical protein
VRRCALVTRSRGEFFLDVADEWQRIRVRISSSDAGLGPRPTRAVRAASRRRRSRDMTRICRCGLTAEQSGGQHDIMDPAAHAQAIVAAWHKKLIAGALPRPSPTIATVLAAGYGHLMV